MSVLVVGLSHRSAPVTVLERAAVSGDALGKLLHDVFHAEHVAGTFTVSTCNRVEIYAEVDKFHAGVSVICEMLARHSGVALPELTPHLYVHYEDRAVQHLLSMTCGLESMVVGESQILGQVRRALALARKHQTIGHPLDDLGTLALRTAKRAHTQTGIDRAGANLVTVGAGLAAAALAAPLAPGAAAPATPAATSLAPGAVAPPDPRTAPLHGRTVLVVGAGSMSALAVATVARLGAAGVVVANRTRERAERLAASVGGTTADLNDLGPALAAADLVISCTGATGLVITADMVTAALRERQPVGGARPLVLLDLALPRDVDPKAGRPAWRHRDRPGVAAGRRRLAGRQSGRGRGRGAGHRGRGARRTGVRAACGPGRAHRGGAAGQGRGGGRGGTGPARRAGSARSTTVPAPRSPRPCTGSWISCYMRRRCESRSWPDLRAAIPMRQRCGCFLISTPGRSRR